MKISIIVLAWNKYNFTKNCITDLSKLPVETHEIILIDNGSTDDTRKMGDDPRIRYIRNDTNLGFSAGCNRGFKESKGEIIIFLNNDIRCKTNETWTNKFLNEINKDENNLFGPTGGYIDNDFNFNYETNDRNKPINYIVGWCVGSSRKTLNKLKLTSGGIFSEDFGLAFFEDTDLSFRAKRQKIGLKIIDLPLVHFPHTTVRQLNISNLYEKSKLIFAEKWKNK